MTRRRDAYETPSSSWWSRAFELALHAFPIDFRERWSDDMRVTFAAKVRDAHERSARTPWALIARELANAINAGLQERLHQRVHARRHPTHLPLSAHGAHARMIHTQDIRYAFRLLRRSPGFSLLTVVVLAGGLGLSTFTFSFLYTAMIRALPLSGGASIVRIDPVIAGRRTRVNAGDVERFRTSVSTLTEIGGYGGRDLVVGRDGDRQLIRATVADPMLFTVARTPAMLGRALVPSDAAPGAEPVIVLSHSTWDATFGADSALVNSLIALNGTSTRVVGIMPKRFGFPVASEAWMPLPESASNATESGETLQLVGRLAPGVTHAQAEAEASAILERIITARDTSVRGGAVRVAVESFPSVQFGEDRALVFTILNLLAALILLLALVNVTNLLLARANERIRETAVRLALGATTARLVMQGMWETIILCAAGGILGTAGAAWGLSAITAWTRANLAGNMAFWWVWHADATTIVPAGAFVTVAIATLGSVIAIRTSRMNVREVMQDGNARGGSRRDGRLSRALVTVQVTTVTALMFFGAIAGILAKRTMTLDPGYSTASLLQGGISPPGTRYETPAARNALYRDVHARLMEDGEFDGVLLRRSLAEARTNDGRFALRDTRASGTLPTSHVLAVLGDTRTVGVQILEGRAFDASDSEGRAPVAVISRSLALQHWRGRSPVGDQVRLAGVGDTTEFRTIVGVASDIPYGSPIARDRTPDAIYLPLLQADLASSAFVVRYRTSEIAARQALMKSFGLVDPMLVPDTVQPLAEILRKLSLITVSVSKLFAACFAFALVLALVGTYGIMSRSIGSRTREIGVRRALGSSDARVARLLLWQGGRQLGIGTLLAVPLLFATGLAFRHYFPISGWLIAGTGALVSLSIVSLVLATTWVPTRKTLRVGLHDALRME